MKGLSASVGVTRIGAKSGYTGVRFGIAGQPTPALGRPGRAPVMRTAGDRSDAELCGIASRWGAERDRFIRPRHRRDATRRGSGVRSQVSGSCG